MTHTRLELGLSKQDTKTETINEDRKFSLGLFTSTHKVQRLGQHESSETRTIFSADTGFFSILAPL